MSNVRPAKQEMDALAALFWLYGGALGALAIGALYFARASQFERVPVAQRILTSAYAPATALVFLLGAFSPRNVWIDLGRNSFLLAQLMPAALLLYALAAYPGKRSLHFFLVPPALLCWFWQVGIGTMFIYGK